jgi:hypothetical protein
MIRNRISAVSFLLVLALALPATAGDEYTPFTAHQGLALAQDAASTWSADAQLVYLENDEAIAADGTADRWGYLFFSLESGDSRGYSLRNGEVLEASDLVFDLAAAPLPRTWMDSADVLAAAHDDGGEEYCEEFQGELSNMFLIRGAFHQQDPDRSTWVLVYTSAEEPTLYVVVDASDGSVVRKMKG